MLSYMTELQVLVYGIVTTALFFDFVNGFHDSANSIATVAALIRNQQLGS